MVELSVIVPIRNEAPGLVELHRELTDTLERWGRSYEIVAIDDGSTDDSFAVLSRLHALDPRLRVIRFRRNFGQTAAFSAGFAHARGRLIVTFDGDLQNDPRDIPAMIAKLESGYDIVCGWRKDRKDAFVSRTVPSMLANRLISWATGVRLHDYGCSLKAFRAEVVKPLRLYGEMHRFIPAIASEQGVAIAEVVVNHRSRRHGTSNYGISRTIRVVLDLLTVKFLLSYSTRPLQIFGLDRVRDGAAGRARRSLAHLREVRRSRTGDCRPAAAAAVDPSDLHGRAARHARPARGNAGAHVSRVAEEADVRHPRGPRSGNDVVTEKRSGGGQRRIAWVLLLASAAAVLVTGLIGTALILAQLGGGPDARSPRFWVGLAAAAALTIASLMLRSLRWIFLLRRAQVRIPIRDAYIGYFAGLSLLLTPFLLGEIAVRAAVLRARGRVPTATVVVVNLWERLLDLVALGIIAGVLAIRPRAALGLDRDPARDLPADSRPAGPPGLPAGRGMAGAAGRTSFRPGPGARERSACPRDGRGWWGSSRAWSRGACPDSDSGSSRTAGSGRSHWSQAEYAYAASSSLGGLVLAPGGVLVAGARSARRAAGRGPGRGSGGGFRVWHPAGDGGRGDDARHGVPARPSADPRPRRVRSTSTRSPTPTTCRFPNRGAPRCS